MINSDGIIVILSYPDTFVRTSYWEFSSKFWPLIGIGDKNKILAGHSALLLIQKNKPNIDYFDFGRYITSYGNGRVRSEETDPEVLIPVKALFKNDTLINLEEILLWIEKHPEITHGNGRLIASINHRINYNKALNFIQNLTYQGGMRAQIEGVRVHQDYQSQGIGKLLFQHLTSLAKNRNCHIVQLTTDKSRPQAFKFYQELGFVNSHQGFKLHLK